MDPLAIIIDTEDVNPDPAEVESETSVAFVNLSGKRLYIEFPTGKPFNGDNEFPLEEGRVKVKKIKRNAEAGDYDYNVYELNVSGLNLSGNLFGTPKMRIQAH